MSYSVLNEQQDCLKWFFYALWYRTFLKCILSVLLGATFSARLATLLRRGSTRWMLLAQIWPFSNLSHFFKTPKMWQHVATGWPNPHNMLRPTMLRYVALKMLRSFGRVRTGLTLCDNTENWSTHIVVEEIWKFVFFCARVISFSFHEAFLSHIFHYCYTALPRENLPDFRVTYQ